MSCRISVALMPRLAAAILLISVTSVSSADNGWKTLPGHVPRAVARLASNGRLPATNHLSLAIGLPLRDPAALDELLRQLYDPRSTNFHKFLTPAEFAGRFGPTEQDYRAVIKFAAANGLAVAGTHDNRVVLDVEGSASNVEQAFHITLRTYRHPREARNFFAPGSEPSVPASLPVADIGGLNDFSPPRPLARKAAALKVRPLSFNGSGPGGEYAGNDFRNAYVPGTALKGAGQSVGLLEFSAYYKVDITNYEKAIGLTNYVPLTNVVLSGGAPGTAHNDEVALDIEMAIALAPGLSRVIVYEIRSVNPGSILNRMANDNLAKQLSSSWTWSGGPSTTVDNALKIMASQGQSFFQASGDDDAYTGSQTLDNSSQTTTPVDSSYLTSVGGTTLTMNGAGASWSSETVWNHNLTGNPNVGSGGGISAYYPIPYWQTNVSMAINSGSPNWRNVPDVALTADNIFVSFNNGDASGTYYFMGTSCAAPLWAGFCALVNQQSVATSGTTVGFLNPALYAIAKGSNDTNCFHDITNGNNIGTNTAGLFNAVAGYDLCTGLGTPNGTNLINALAPFTVPYFVSQPSNLTVLPGSNAVFSATASGSTPLHYQWRKNGTDLVNGAGISGVTSNVLTLATVATNSSGNYSLFITNNFGAITSRVATLTVNLLSLTGGLVSSENPSGFKDAVRFTVTVMPTNAGGNVLFSANGVAFDMEPVVAGAAFSANIATLPRGTNFITAVYSGDASYLPATNSLAQAVTNHPPVAAPAFYTNTASFTLNIPIADLATNWSDVDGDAVSLAAVSVSTNGITVTNTGTALVYFNANDVADQFTCAMTDGFGGTNFQTVIIAPAPLLNTTPRITGIVAAGNGSVSLSLGGASSYTYILETVTNLIPPANWQPVATNTIGTNGIWQFPDTQATNFTQRFYRLKLAP